MIGFPAAPATGYALGVERILMVARALDTVPALEPAVGALVCSVEPAQAEEAARVARALRGNGIHTVLDVAERRLDRKLRTAGRLGARVAVIIGENEEAAASAVVRDLEGRSQQTVPSAVLADTVLRLMGGGE